VLTPSNLQGVTTTRVRGCLVVTLPQDLSTALDEIRDVVLAGVRNAGAKAVVLELSAVRVMDCFEFDALRALVEMARMLGARPVLVGLSPGIVAYLVNNNANTRGLEVERGLEDALDRIDGRGEQEALQ
jgi:rsbT antagonist protein RsbS